ncbi:MAG: hypothetical protein M3Y13_14705, partial [Armatimonadota bacterium]|nr:hypothetical protein [Armatimonadota bacterium]
MLHKILSVLILTITAAAGTLVRPMNAAPLRAPSGLLDTLTFGDPASEQAHGLAENGSRVVRGGLGESARVLLPRTPQAWEGGSVAFTLKVDPVKLNYFTVRLWGGEASQNRLILFCEGKQIGYRHIGDIDLLDFGNDSDAPPFNGRFFYKTSPLPQAMTQGKTRLHFEIRSIGRIWGYGTTFEQYQKPMTEPTRALYRVYTHTDGFFAPPAAEKQGAAPVNAPVRHEPGPEVLDQLKVRETREIVGLLAQNGPLNQMQMQFLARAYGIQWTPAYRNPTAIAQEVKSLDAIFAAYRKDPTLAQSDPATPNPDWFGLGHSGDVLRLLAEPIHPFLDQTIADGAGGKITRRAAYAEMLVASRDWHRRNRRQYTNQSMINDLYGIYLCNRGVEVVDPSKALPEVEARRYLYESIGLQPWLGSETDHGPARPLGDNYLELTAQGLTKELGFVGYYGEVLDWVTLLYDATRPAPDQPGDPKIKAQLVKIAHARTPFRYPMLDADGNRAMRAETIVGWRDDHYPGDVTYAERPSWDASTLYAAAATLDPALVGAAQQMFADNQFFASLRGQMKETGFRSTVGLLGTPDQYALLQAQPPSPHRLPMAPGQPDFVWTDEEDGVLALKHGDDVLYVSLYWRARNAINYLARVHYVTPTVDHIAVVHEDEQFEPSGLTYTRPDEVNAPYLPWLPHYP